MNPANATFQNRIGTWLGIAAWLAIALGLLHLYGTQGNTDQPEDFGHSTFAWMLSRWNWSGADMSHAWLIPLISLWALWQRREPILSAVRLTDRRGLAVVSLGLITYLVGIRTQQTRIVLLSFIMLLWSMPFYAFGWAVARQLVFPCAYLVFCIPFTFLDDLTLPLRLISTTVSAVVLNGLGISVTRIGTALHVNTGEGFSLDVAHPCSGLRYLVAMIALTTAYAHFTQRVTWRRIVLSVASIPLAMIGNIVRIILIAMVGVWLGTEIAVGFYHDYSGYVVFAVATLLMTWVGSLLHRYGTTPDASTPETPPHTTPAIALPGSHPARYPLLILIILFITMTLLAPALSRVYIAGETTADVKLDLPANFDQWKGEDLLYCQNDQCARSFRTGELDGKTVCPVCGKPLDRIAIGERTILPADTRIARKLYENGKGGQVVATIVLTGGDQRSIHRPQQCLPAQGYAIENRSVLPVQLTDGAMLRMTVMHANPERKSVGSSSKRMVLAYWFAGGGHLTHDHLQRVFWVAWDNLLHGYKARWAYVSLQTSDSGASGDGATALAEFARTFYPLIQRNPPAPSRD